LREGFRPGGPQLDLAGDEVTPSVGLGTPSMAAYAQPEQHWTCFEINSRSMLAFPQIVECVPRLDLGVR